MRKLLENIFIVGLVGMFVLGTMAVLIQIAGILTANSAWMVFVDEKFSVYAIYFSAVVALSGFVYPYVIKKEGTKVQKDKTL